MYIKGLTSADKYGDIPAGDVTYTEDDIIRWMTSAPMFSSSFTYLFQHVFPVCEQVSEIYTILPYRIKIDTEFNLATWLKLVKFTEF